MSQLKKISVSQLRPGMFIQEMDISWLKNPFLRHRRKIENKKDIALLKRSGVRVVTIDLEQGRDVLPTMDAENIAEEKEVEQGTNNTTEETEKENSNNNVQEVENPEPKLTDELKAARAIQGKIQSLVTDINEKIKKGEPIEVKEILPIIDESLESLKRNDQALLSILHMHRQDARLDAHAFGVFSIVLPLAIKCKRSAEEIEILGMAALLHDCGWSRLPLNLLGKGKKYNGNEKKLIEQHTNIGLEALRISNCVSKDVLQLVEQHHEIANGQGYPKQTSEEGLHELHDYLQIADIYDENIHGLLDKPGVLPANALKLLYKKSSQGYFPTSLVTEMIRIMGIYPISTVVRLTTEEIGIVREVNRQLPLLPKIDLILDAKNEPYVTVERIDLSAEHENRLILDILDNTFITDKSLL